MVYLTCSVVFQSSLDRGFRYFKVWPIKAFRDIRRVSVEKFLQLAGKVTLSAH
jgi:hypothetical protein